MAEIAKTAYDLLCEVSESEGSSLESSALGGKPFINPETGEPLVFTDAKYGDLTYVADTIFGKKAFREVGSGEMRDYGIKELKSLRCSQSQGSRV